MTDNDFKCSLGEFEISIDTKSTSFGYEAIGYCPICANRVIAEDHNFGEKYVFNIVCGRIRSHMKSVHKLQNKL